MLSPKAATQAIARNAMYGGYEYALVMADGALVCTSCVRDNYRLIREATRDDMRDGWQALGFTHTGEMDEVEWCANCNRSIG